MNKLLSIGAILVLLGILFAYFMYNKPHRDIQKEKVSSFVTLDEIYEEFEQDESVSFQNYHEKVIVVSARLTSVGLAADSTISLILEGAKSAANCQVRAGESLEYWRQMTGQEVQVKGLFVGFDDLLGEVQMREVSKYEQ